MAKKAIQFVVVDAFTAEPFKGNPAAVCFLEDDAAAPAGDGRWMQSVAVEFNLSQTAFLSRDSSSSSPAAAAPRFHLRWFTPVTEVALCGHATLASAHFLFTAVLPEHHGVVEFATKSGVLTAKKVPAPPGTEEQGKKLFIELDFPASDFVGPGDELPSIPETLNGASVVSVHRSATTDDFIVEVSSGKEVADLLPNTEEIRKCAGRGVIITAPAPPGSGYDFFSRFFCPKFGIDECTLCFGTLLGWKTGETKTDRISGISKEWNTIPGAGRCKWESANSRRSCYCHGWDTLRLAAYCHVLMYPSKGTH